MSANERVGSKYSKELRTVEIAKLVRLDVKAAIASGELPKGIKIGVKSRSFAGGSAVDVSIKSFPGALMNPAWVYANALNVYEPRSRSLFTEQARRALRTLESILNAYNRDSSDSMTDYFCTNFYGHVDVRANDQEAAEKAVLRANDALADLRVAKTAGVDLEAFLDAYDASGDRLLWSDSRCS